MASIEIDIGHDHYVRYFGWYPDDLPGNRERYGVPLPRVAKAGIFIRHRGKNPDYPYVDKHGWCKGAVHFDIPEMYLMQDKGPWWTVESWDPLTLSPSILCGCGDHGFIKEGRWVPA
jgi:hypothetical protein